LQSICISFANDFEYAYLSDVTFRTDVYQRTLEDLDQHLIDGRNHIESRLGIGKIPDELAILVPKCASAYTFIQWWEAEGRSMGDGTELSRNYYDRLIAQIDDSIDAWLEAHPEILPDEINLKLLGYTWVVQ
jgi:3-deoxy-D-arabino-heptulosonate 7-phosphate (DAHP) synthase class II